MTPVRAEAVRTLYLQTRNSRASVVVVTAYMIGTAASYTAWPTIAAWAAVQLATQIARELLVRAWFRHPREDAALGRWANIYTLYMVVTGSLWGSTIFLFAHPAEPITVALTLCCLYGVAGGSVPANAYNPPGLYALVGFMFAPVVARLLAAGGFDFILLGVASGLFALAMVGMCRVQAQTLDAGFQIRFENRALLVALTAKTAEAEAARQRAELASLAKSQFLAAASHDLRQPLYALSLFSASLDELRLDADGRAIVGSIQDSVGAMESLFNGLLDLSKLEAGVVTPRLGAVSADALFDRLSQYFHPIALGRGLDLRFRSDGEWVTSDGALLEQVLSNLISNALRCTAQGGVLVAARKRPTEMLFEVWDTGIGIEPADMVRIFDEFVQVGNAERDRRKGLGLGLSIARRSAALIGAAITVASRPGRGSCFAFAQPATRQVMAAIGEAPHDMPHSAIVRRLDLPVLVVDDDRDVRLAISGLLRQWGVDFDAAADGDAALALIAAGARYGLVLADHRLSGSLNGLDLIAEVAARQAPPPASILITADFDPGLIAAARSMGVPVLPKPLRSAELRALLGIPVRS